MKFRYCLYALVVCSMLYLLFVLAPQQLAGSKIFDLVLFGAVIIVILAVFFSYIKEADLYRAIIDNGGADETTGTPKSWTTQKNIYAFMDVANVVYSLVFLKMKFAWMKRAEWKPYLKEVYLFSIWIFFVVAFSQINAYLGKTVLGVMVDSGKTVTVFTYGFQFFAYESLMSQGISNNFSPKINALAVQHKDQEVASLWLRASKLQLVVLFLVVGGFITCGLDFVSYWLRKSHLSPTDFRDIYILGVGFLLLWLIPLSETVGIEAQRAYNKHRFLAIFNLSCAIVSIGIAILCVAYLPTKYKIYGPLIGMAFSVISGMIIASNIYYKKAMSVITF